MTGYLLAAWLGPVQTFIQAARRTRDLWLGSAALAHCAAAAARALAGQDARLIFPAPAALDAPVSPRSLNVANKLLAEVPAGADCAAAARHARDAARAAWLDLAADALGHCPPELIDQERFQAQAGDVLEWAAAWVPRSDSYQADRARVEALLSARRALREFLPARGNAPVFKSSLDSSRETVLHPHAPPRLEIARGEELDAVGIVKRFAWAGRRFRSVSRVAAGPWLRRVKQVAPGDLAAISQVLKGLPGLVAPVDDDDFPYDTDVFYPARLGELAREAAGRGRPPAAVAQLTELVRQVCRSRGFPNPYVAILLADGDHMGRLLARADSPESHQELSAAASEFAREAAAIVRTHHGELVYSGGDDVLALLPAETSVACARALHDEFARRLARASRGEPPTMSAGIALGHSLEPLADLLAAAREAERLAKDGHAGQPPRDALALLVRTRSGGGLALRRPWTEAPERWLNNWRSLLANGSISGGAVYDLRQLAAFYGSWEGSAPPPALLAADAYRLLGSKQGGAPIPESLRRRLDQVTSPADLSCLADELLVGRFLHHVAPEGAV